MKHIHTFESFLTESALNESTISNFKPDVLDRSNTLDEKFFKKLMPRAASTSDSAMSHIWSFEGNIMFAHYQYFIVKPIGNKPDRPTYRIHNSQYWLNSAQLKMQRRDPKEEVNVTLLTFFDITDAANEKTLGMVWVDTDVYLDEQKKVFEIANQQS